MSSRTIRTRKRHSLTITAPTERNAHLLTAGTGRRSTKRHEKTPRSRRGRANPNNSNVTRQASDAIGHEHTQSICTRQQLLQRNRQSISFKAEVFWVHVKAPPESCLVQRLVVVIDVAEALSSHEVLDRAKGLAQWPRLRASGRQRDQELRDKVRRRHKNLRLWDGGYKAIVS